jgi:hypothetical protein
MTEQRWCRVGQTWMIVRTADSSAGRVAWAERRETPGSALRYPQTLNPGFRFAQSGLRFKAHPGT